MTRKKWSADLLRVCIGVLFLIIDVDANATSSPGKVPEIDSQINPKPEPPGSRTLLKKFVNEVPLNLKDDQLGDRVTNASVDHTIDHTIDHATNGEEKDDSTSSTSSTDKQKLLKTTELDSKDKSHRKSPTSKYVSEDFFKSSKSSGSTNAAPTKVGDFKSDDGQIIAAKNVPQYGEKLRKNSEDSTSLDHLEDLISGTKDGDRAISLLNDTRVNYDHYYKTLDDSKSKNLTANSVGESSTSKSDPKDEVEVVGNVTYPPILKIVVDENTKRLNEESQSKSNELEDHVVDKDKEVKKKTEKVVIGDEGEEGETKKANENEDSESIVGHNSTYEPSPRARTISSFGINELSSSNDVKTTTSTRTISNDSYPYTKSTIDEITNHTLENSETSDKSTTEEDASPYDNTIGRRESEIKFVVTEPSVVIENSILQFKSAHDKRSGNASSNIESSTTESISQPPSTVSILHDISETNITDKVELVSPASSTSVKENDVPKGSSETIPIKSENIDVTGNGITEVSTTEVVGSSLNPEGVSSSLPARTFNESIESTFSSENSTDKVGTISKADVQTNAEESLLMRSNFNVTEGSTIGAFSTTRSPEPSTTVITKIQSITPTEENITLIPLTGADEMVSTQEKTTNNDVTTNTDIIDTTTVEITEPTTATIPTTTASIEYEFVGLTDSNPTNPNHTLTSSTENNASTIDVDSNATVEAKTTMHNESPPFESTTKPTTWSGTNGPAVTSAPDNETMVTEETDTSVTITTMTIPEQEEKTRVHNESDVVITDHEIPTTRPNSSITSITIATTKYEEPVMNFTEPTLIVSTTEKPEVPIVDTITSSIKPFTTSSVPGTTNRIIPKIDTSPSTTMYIPTNTLSPDEIVLLVKIIIEGTRNDVCPHISNLQHALAEILTTGLDKPVSSKQIRFHQNPCEESIMATASSSSSPSDVGLTSFLVYIVDEEGDFDEAMTRILPNLYKVSHINLPSVTIHSFLLVQEADSGNAIAVVIVSSVAFICLVLLAGLLFIMRKRQTRFNYGERCRPVSLDAYSLDSVSAYNSVRRKGVARSSKRSYGNPTFEDSSAIPSHPLNFAGLSSFCNDVTAINEEFSNIPQVSSKIDELPPGAEVKNRYANVIPLPETRVPLQRLNNDPLTEYINASYVRGPKNATKYYIACQAPMESTTTDFWRMIWEQQSKVIIMLTDLVENGVEKCAEYVPPLEVTDCHRLYGDFQVTLKKRETKDKYAISTLHLKNLENNTFREVYHIWYLWPVNGVQSDGTGLIAILLEARALQRGGPGPIVVHCSPGTGRTGTLIALDLGIRQYEITRTVDVPRVVYTIRRDRAGAVQTKEQYAFIYKALNLYATKLAGGVLEST